jgi:hypothetical protein
MKSQCGRLPDNLEAARLGSGGRLVWHIVLGVPCREQQKGDDDDFLAASIAKFSHSAGNVGLGEFEETGFDRDRCLVGHGDSGRQELPSPLRIARSVAD